MQAKNVMYAAVGAPVVAARKLTDQVNEIRGKVSKEALDGWAVEGEKVVSGIREGKVVEEISQKVDLDQAKEQVSKLRDQLEDMLATWRQSFRPEKTEDNGSAAKPAAKKSAAKKPAAKKPAAKSAASKPANKAAAAKTTAKSGTSTAAKKSPAKKTPATGGATKASSTS